MCVCVCPKKNPSSRLPSLPSCCAPMLQRLFALQAAERLMLFLHACEVRGEGSACVCTMELRLIPACLRGEARTALIATVLMMTE